MPDLSGKVAIVTGAASGIGAATAQRLVECGATVVTTDVQVEQGQQQAKAIGATFMEQDVSQAARWSEVVDATKAQCGRLDILINNAGLTLGKSIEDIELEHWNRGINILLTGVMLGCQNAIRVMKTNPDGASGSIINVASTTAFTALPGDVTYTSAKSGVRMLSKSVAVHCAQQGYKIRCNALIPGATMTGITATLPEPVLATVAATSPLNRLADPKELAAAAAFLASDECLFMTGSELMVDGGALAVHPGF
ncbi:MAG: SDR family oxidoreductase [Pseudomonadales bacterium]